MRRLFIAFLAAYVLTNTLTAQTTTLPQQAVLHNKAFLLDYYQQTFDQLKKAMDGLSEAQLQFKPAPDRWSISQCLDHIILTEKALFGFAQQTMAQAPNPERRSEVKMTDEDVISGMTNRSFKAKASKELTPVEAGKYKSAGEAIETLRKQRTELLDYINGLSEEDMRNRITDSPFGPVDGYHSLLYIPGHTARHTLQIEEVKADPNFPKK